MNDVTRPLGTAIASDGRLIKVGFDHLSLGNGPGEHPGPMDILDRREFPGEGSPTMHAMALAAIARRAEFALNGRRFKSLPMPTEAYNGQSEFAADGFEHVRYTRALQDSENPNGSWVERWDVLLEIED